MAGVAHSLRGVWVGYIASSGSAVCVGAFALLLKMRSILRRKLFKMGHFRKTWPQFEDLAFPASRTSSVSQAAWQGWRTPHGVSGLVTLPAAALPCVVCGGVRTTPQNEAYFEQKTPQSGPHFEALAFPASRNSSGSTAAWQGWRTPYGVSGSATLPAAPLPCVWARSHYSSK